MHLGPMVALRAKASDHENLGRVTDPYTLNPEALLQEN